jgi:hypothetical protein
MSETTELAPALPLRPQDEVECRRCEVHCEKVVYPSACLARSCPFVYAYEEHGHTFMGCMQRMCRSEVDPCFEHRAGELGCVNPEFNELPAGSPTFRVFARLS